MSPPPTLPTPPHRPLHCRPAQQSQEPLQQEHRGEDEGRAAAAAQDRTVLSKSIHVVFNACFFTQKKEAVGEDESLPEAAQDLEALTAETLSVRLCSVGGWKPACCLTSLPLFVFLHERT